MEETTIIKSINCQTCKQSFDITDWDQAFYKKIDAPEPVDCYHCRQQRRQAYRNERNLYNDQCDKCDKKMLSIYSEEKALPTYCSDCWWGDNWDPIEYGKDFDFSRPFFEQWNELWQSVPKLGLITLGEMENSEYSHDAMKLKNCYLTFDGEQATDCMYGETFHLLKDCVDFLWLQQSELCYEIVNCTNCYNLEYSQFCTNCSESKFLQDCVGCKNCLGCVNRCHAEYEIFNKKYSKEEYEEKLKTFGLHEHNNIQKFKEEFKTFASAQPKKSMRGLQNENVTGDNLSNSKDSFHCFDSNDLHDCKYMTNCVLKANDSMDIDIWGNGMELCYNCECAGEGAHKIFGSFYCAFNVHDCYNCAFCWQSCNNLLGCVNLKHKTHCILNKQYSPEEYENLFARIKEHMIKTGEWMQFFPMWTSPFGYNETVAQEYFPLEKDQALALNAKWKEKNMSNYKHIDFTPPNTIAETTDEILQTTISCEKCSKNYRITSPELKFYRKKNIPVPRQCSDCRHTARMQLRNPRHLYTRNCDKSEAKLQTTISPKRPEKILSPEEFVKEYF